MVYGGEKYEKKRVGVDSYTDPEGYISPLSITWSNGQIYKITFSTDEGMKPCEHLDEYAHRWLIDIQKNKRYLYKDKIGWFVEIKSKDHGDTGKWPPTPLWDPEA